METEDMNRTKSDAIDKLSDQAETIFEHIIKLQCYPDSGAARHWRIELAAQATKLRRYVRGKKGAINLGVDDFLTVIYEERLADSPVLHIMETYGPCQVQPNPELLKIMVIQFANDCISQAKIK